jgi:hypothetical protein
MSDEKPQVNLPPPTRTFKFDESTEVEFRLVTQEEARKLEELDKVAGHAVALLQIVEWCVVKAVVAAPAHCVGPTSERSGSCRPTRNPHPGRIFARDLFGQIMRKN